MSVDVSSLKRQRSTVLSGIDNSREQINILSDKRTRLQTATSNLESSIMVLETNLSNVESLSIDNNRWRGTEQNNFSNHYSSYEVSVRNYYRKVNDAKDTIDEEISRIEQSIAGYETGLSNLQSTLNSLDSQISTAESR